MKWPRRKGKVNLEKGEAAKAARDAQCRLVETRARWPEVKAVAETLAAIRERNHFAEAIKEAFVGEGR